MPPSRREHLRTSLVDAAEQVIAEKGLAHLKARDLAREVGCAVGAIYTVFPDLDALILTVNLRTLALLEAALADPEGPAKGADAVVDLAQRYLAFAQAHRPRWRALFEHRMAGEAPPPDWYLAEQVRLFRYIEEPLRSLRPDLPADEIALLARTFFSATHGIVSLGLDEKLASLPSAILRTQVGTVVRAAAEGLTVART